MSRLGNLLPMLSLRPRKMDGDVLIFMPGAFEIARTIEEIKRSEIRWSCFTSARRPLPTSAGRRGGNLS